MSRYVQGVHELNRTTAVYVSVARDLGSMIDSLVLRRQLTCIRKRALLIAHQNKRNILPHLRRLVSLLILISTIGIRRRITADISRESRSLILSRQKTPPLQL